MSFVDRLRNAWNIFKLALSLLKKDRSLIIVPITIVFLPIIILVLCLLIFIKSLIIIFGSSWKETILPYLSAVSFAGAILFVLFIIFLITFLESVQVWMVYEVLKKGKTSISSGFGRAFKNFGDITAFTFTTISFTAFSFFLRSEGGKVGQTTANVMDYLTSLAGKLVLPAMIITERNFKEAIKQLKESTIALPEIAAYEIGIRPLIFFLLILGGFISITIFIFMTWVFNFWGGGFFFAFPFLIFWILMVILLSIYVNETYYTILYIKLIEKQKIEKLI